jgi:drug/metabolite transporter (DMT)-like permease
MMGEALAILSALMQAISTVLSAEALKNVDPIWSNVIKSLASAAVMFPIVAVTGVLFGCINVRTDSLFFVILAAIVGFGFGDTFLFKSIVLIGVSRAYTISFTSPLFTMVLAIIFLNETFLLKYLIGTAFIVISLAIVSLELEGEGQKDASLRGVIAAVAAALCWAVGTVLAALGLRGIDVLLANAIRFPILALFLLLISKPREKRRVARRDFMLLSASGVTGMVFGGITFLLSIQLIGASRASPLNASSPVLTSVISKAFLKEKVTLRLISSSIFITIGIYFLVS